MHVLGPQIQPELPGQTMAQPIARLRVQHHLGIAGRGAGEIDDARIVAAGPFAAKPGAGLADAAVEINPAWPLTAHQQARALKAANLGHPVLVGDDGADAGARPAGRPRHAPSAATCRDRHRPQPDEAEHGNPPLRHPRQHEQDAVPAPDPAGAQETRRLATQRRQLPETESLLRPGRGVDAPKGRSVRALLGPTVNHVGGKVEVERRCEPLPGSHCALG